MVKRLENRSVRRQRKKTNNDEATLIAIQAVKMVSLYTLRNQGWGDIRLKRFSDQWNETLKDVNNGLYSLSDIADVIYDETGLRVNGLELIKREES